MATITEPRIYLPSPRLGPRRRFTPKLVTVPWVIGSDPDTYTGFSEEDMNDIANGFSMCEWRRLYVLPRTLGELVQQTDVIYLTGELP